MARKKTRLKKLASLDAESRRAEIADVAIAMREIAEGFRRDPNTGDLLIDLDLKPADRIAAARTWLKCMSDLREEGKHVDAVTVEQLEDYAEWKAERDAQLRGTGPLRIAVPDSDSGDSTLN